MRAIQIVARDQPYGKQATRGGLYGEGNVPDLLSHDSAKYRCGAYKVCADEIDHRYGVEQHCSRRQSERRRPAST